MNNDLISKRVLMEQLKKATENAISYDFKKGLLEAQRIVLNLQEQEEKLYEIKVNVPDDIKERLIHDLQDPKFFDSRRIFAEKIKSTNDCITAYGDGFESARRLFERPHGKWIKSKDGYTRCDQCGSRGSAIKARFCHHCGADMRKGGAE